MEHTRFEIDSSPERREVGLLKDRIDTFNVDETKIYDFKELAIFLRDPMGDMIAGLYAYTLGGAWISSWYGYARTAVGAGLDRA